MLMRKGLAWPWGWGWGGRGQHDPPQHVCCYPARCRRRTVAVEGGWKGREERSEAFPDRRRTREEDQGGVRSLFPSPSQSLPLCFCRSSIPPSQLRGEAWPPDNECFGYSLAQKPRGKCKQSADGMPPSKFPYLVLAAAAER